MLLGLDASTITTPRFSLIFFYYQNCLFSNLCFRFQHIISLFQSLLLLYSIFISILYPYSFYSGLLVRSFIRSFVHSFILSFFHSFTFHIPITLFLQFQKSIESNTRQNNRQIHFIHSQHFYSISFQLIYLSM